MSSGEVDLFLLEAQREVDALTPATPPIAPSLCGAVLGRHKCVKDADHLNDYHQAQDGTLWLSETIRGRDYRNGGRLVCAPRSANDTGPRPPGTGWDATVQEFVLPNGVRIPQRRVEQSGWRDVLVQLAERTPV